MAQTFTVPSTAYAADTYPFGPFAINAGSSSIHLDVLRDPALNLPGVEVLRMEAVCSFDGGVTWQATTAPSTPPEVGVLGSHDAMLFGMDGSPSTPGRTGPVLSASYTTSITTPCQVKGQFVVSQPLTTTITVTLT